LSITIRIDKRISLEIVLYDLVIKNNLALFTSSGFLLIYPADSLAEETKALSLQVIEVLTGNSYKL
jgi:hypothetical protein